MYYILPVCNITCLNFLLVFAVSFTPETPNFGTFGILEGKIKRTKDTPKYIEIENITPLSILKLKSAIGNTDLLSQFDLKPQADPNFNYNLLSSIIDQAKSKHIPKKSKKINKCKHKKEPWMTNYLQVIMMNMNIKTSISKPMINLLPKK